MLPTYEPSFRHLTEALRSVITQSPNSDQLDIEVVDDCSPTVNVAELVHRQFGRRVRVFRSPNNLGLAGCWNLCISRASGEFVHILHQDDAILPGFYTALETGFASNSMIGAAFCRHAFMDEDSHWMFLSDLEARSPGILHDFVTRLSAAAIVQCPSIAVRRSVYEKIGPFRTDLPHTLDWDMWARIAKAYPVFYDPRILACYRMHEGSTTARQVRTGEQQNDIFRALRSFSGNLTPAAAARARRIYALKGIHTVRLLIKKGDFPASLRNLKVIIRNCPEPVLCLYTLKMLVKLSLAVLSRYTSGAAGKKAGISAELTL